MLRVLALALLAAAPASAACLDESDLGRGVVVTYANGDSTLMRRGADGYVGVEERYANGDPTMRLRAHRGIYFVGEVQLDERGAEVPGSRLEVRFAEDPATFPDPAPGVTWTGRGVNVFADGAERPETTTATFSAAPPLTLGDCTYEAVTADLRYDWGPDGGLTLRYLFLPEIGTGIILSNQFDGGELNETVPVSLTLATK